MAFMQPWQSTNTTPRRFQGVVRHADVTPATGAIGAWSDIHRAPIGDARGSSANALIDEFLGDYDYAFATNDFVVAVWNDARNAADCPGDRRVPRRRRGRHAAGVSTDPTRPAPKQDCPATFGNTTSSAARTPIQRRSSTTQGGRFGAPLCEIVDYRLLDQAEFGVSKRVGRRGRAK
jgi:hypothetical protein